MENIKNLELRLISEGEEIKKLLKNLNRCKQY